MTRKARPAHPMGAVAASDMADVQRVALAKAKDGDVRAMAIIERMWRDRPVVIDLPPVTGAESLAEAQSQVFALAASGQITPRHGLAFTTMLEWRRRALAVAQLNRALDALEAANTRRAAEQATKR